MIVMLIDDWDLPAIDALGDELAFRIQRRTSRNRHYVRWTDAHNASLQPSIPKADEPSDEFTMQLVDGGAADVDDESFMAIYICFVDAGTIVEKPKELSEHELFDGLDEDNVDQ